MKKKLIVISLSIILIAAFIVIIGQTYGNDGERAFIISQPESASVAECRDQEKKKEVIVHITKTGIDSDTFRKA